MDLYSREPSVGSNVTYASPEVYRRACELLPNGSYKDTIRKCLFLMDTEFKRHKFRKDLIEYYQQQLPEFLNPKEDPEWSYF